MKFLLTAAFVLALFSLQAQSEVAPQPIEQQYHISYWWWIIGVLLAIGVGVLIYLLIKKDPKRDAVR